MLIGIPKEIKNNENRVAPVSYTHLEKQSYETQVEAFGAQPFSFVKSHFQANQLPSPL